jgi:ketosteroid isomerase-like protein
VTACGCGRAADALDWDDTEGEAMSNTEVVRAIMDAYYAEDRETAERLIADDLVFTSPYDEHIDRAAYFERCFPTAGRTVSHHILQIVPAGDDAVFLRYEYELETGDVHRNAEFITVRDGQIHEIEVYFGGKF